jgi:hypothetical protein
MQLALLAFNAVHYLRDVGDELLVPFQDVLVQLPVESLLVKNLLALTLSHFL